MASRVKADTIRRQVRQIFQERGALEGAEMCESLLIRGGFFCGRRFEMDGFCAVWFVEEDELKIYDRDGKVLLSDDVEIIRRRAAA